MKTHDINTKTLEGQYLLAALAMLTTTIYTDKTPDEVMELIDELKNKMDFS